MTELSVDVEAVFTLPAGSEAAPAGTAAGTAPLVVPVRARLETRGPPVTVATFVPPDVPPSTTSPDVNPETASLNVTVKLIGDVPVGSAWPAALFAVTVALIWSNETELSVLVGAVFWFVAASPAAPAPTDAVSVPLT